MMQSFIIQKRHPNLHVDFNHVCRSVSTDKTLNIGQGAELRWTLGANLSVFSTTVIREARQSDKKTIHILRQVVLAFIAFHVLIIAILAFTFIKDSRI